MKLRSSKGSITIFVSIILIVMILVSQLLVEYTRISYAIKHVTSSSSLAAQSVLSNYDKELKVNYGLFGLNIEDTKKLAVEFGNFYNETLYPSKIDEDRTMKPFNFTKSVANVSPIYNLAQPSVIENQILKFMKYRAPKIVTEDLIEKLKGLANLKKASEVFGEKLKVDEAVGELWETEKVTYGHVKNVNFFGNPNEFETEIDAIAKEIKKKLDIEQNIKNIIAMKEKIPETFSAEGISNHANFYAQISVLQAQKNILNNNINQEEKYMKDKIESTLDEVNGALEGFKKLKNDSENVQKSIEAAEEVVGTSTDDFSNKIKAELEAQKGKYLEDSIIKHISKLNGNKQILENINNSINYRSINLDVFNNIVPTEEKIREKIYSGGIKDSLSKYKGYFNKGNSISYYVDIPTNKDEGKEQSDIIGKESKDIKEVEHEQQNKEIDNLPSQIKNDNKLTDMQIETLKKDKLRLEAFYKNIYKATNNVKDTTITKKYGMFEATPIDKENAIKESKKSMQFLGAICEMISNSMLGIRDELYTNEYITGMFRNKLVDENSDILDMRGEPLFERSSYFDQSGAEIEYILTGSLKESTNINSVRNKIFLIRLALNTLALYMDKEKMLFVKSTAATIGAFTAGIGAVVAETIIVIGLATAESMLDIKHLNNGEKVPIYKMKGSWYIEPQNITSGVLTAATDKIIDQATGLAEDSFEQVSNKIKSTIDYRIDIMIDTLLQPAENSLMLIEQKLKTQDIINESIDNYEVNDISNNMKSLEQSILDMLMPKVNIMNAEFEEIMKDIIGIQKDGKEEVNKLDFFSRIFKKGDLVEEYENKKNAFIQDQKVKLQKFKDELKENAQKMIDDNYKEIEGNLKIEFEKALKQGGENIHQFISKSTGTFKSSSNISNNKSKMNVSKDSKTINSKSHILQKFISFDYNDYLKVFLLFTPREDKLLRTADIIQLNMIKITGDETFELIKRNTCIRVEGTSNLKYLFLPTDLFKNNVKGVNMLEHKINFIHYKYY